MLSATLALTSLPVTFARAAGSDTTTPPVATETTTTCTDGKIWSDEKKECLAPEAIAEPATGGEAEPGKEPETKTDTAPATEEEKKSERSTDDILYEAAREFAYAGQHENAIRALKAASDQNDPRILNYMGYNLRKLGQVELGMRYYQKALAIDSDYILARSYMGQALFEQGDVEGARVQLVEIRDRGGEGTWAYRALLETIGGTRATY
ncbi:hypothetical protein LXM94_16850 [Rhizobium sp. TRM95111]|nr:hypothetical protein [Rhizobium alarense]MCF3641643.1 hypothetical protein [Rhizobium alarense]